MATQGTSLPAWPCSRKDITKLPQQNLPALRHRKKPHKSCGGFKLNFQKSRGTSGTLSGQEELVCASVCVLPLPLPNTMLTQMGTGRATSFMLPLHVSSRDWNRVSTSLHSTCTMTVWTRAGSEWTHQLQTQETWLSRPCPHPDKPVRDLAVPPRWHQYNAHVDSPCLCPFQPRLSSLHDPSQVPTWKTPSLHPSTSAAHQHGPDWYLPRRPPDSASSPSGSSREGPAHCPPGSSLDCTLLTQVTQSAWPQLANT